jgi:hypothetical protein
MAHFIGYVAGARGEESRLGNKDSGIRTTAASYAGAIKVHLYHENGVDRFVVMQTPWQGAGVDEQIAAGIVGVRYRPE